MIIDEIKKLYRVSPEEVDFEQFKMRTGVGYTRSLADYLLSELEYQHRINDTSGNLYERLERVKLHARNGS